MAIHQGPLRYHFLCVAATLLGIPYRYEDVIADNQFTIVHPWRSYPFIEKEFGAAHMLSISQVA
jgi:hypothetical protein